MAKFGKRSKERLATCDEKLQKIFNEVIKELNFQHTSLKLEF